MFPPRRPDRRAPFPPHHYRTPYSHQFLQYFVTDDGKVDFEKVFHSIDQVSKIVKHADPLVKQIATIIKKNNK